MPPLHRGLEALLELRKALGQPLVEGRVGTPVERNGDVGITRTVRLGFFPDGVARPR